MLIKASNKGRGRAEHMGRSSYYVSGVRFSLSHTYYILKQHLLHSYYILINTLLHTTTFNIIIIIITYVNTILIITFNNSSL
jgi:hypothetical protein